MSNTDKKIMVYVTKHVLTKGLRYLEVEFSENYPDMVSYKQDHWVRNNYHKNEWFINKEDAIKRSEQLRDNKIKSLENQIKKLKEMKFEI